MPSVGSLDAALRELARARASPRSIAPAPRSLSTSTPELRARFDRDALARIVGNLLDNAEKYGRDADDRTIELAARPPATTRSRSSSPITAPASPTRRARSCSAPFSRGVAADGPAGLGLGLALSQSLARAMGGDLDVPRPPTAAARRSCCACRAPSA